MHILSSFLGFLLSLKKTFYFCVGIWVDVCMRTGAHEEGAGSLELELQVV